MKVPIHGTGQEPEQFNTDTSQPRQVLSASAHQTTKIGSGDTPARVHTRKSTLILIFLAGACAVGFPILYLASNRYSDAHYAQFLEEQARTDQKKKWDTEFDETMNQAKEKADAELEALRTSRMTHVSANVLYAAYEANEVAADEKYKDKSVVLTGRIQSIGKDILGTPFLIIGGSGKLDGVQCMFTKSAASQLARLSKGQSIVISGKVSGRVAGLQVLVSDCTLR